MSLLKVATTQFSLKKIASEESFYSRCESLVVQAHKQGAKVLLFPEYFSIPLLLFSEKKGSFFERIRSSSQHIQELSLFFKKLSQDYNIVIIMGTVLFPESQNLYNRSFVFFPDGREVFQDKAHLTRFEQSEWKLTPGSSPIQTFDIQGVSCSICICYDIEFPNITSQLNSQILFVPSSTKDVFGYWRVRHCAQARTVENQCYVVMASCVDGGPYHPAISEHFGQGGVYSPSDIGFSPEGIVSLGEANQEGICIGEINIPLVEKIRSDGTVLNLKDRSLSI